MLSLILQYLVIILHLPPIDINFSILSNFHNLADLCDNAMEQEFTESLSPIKLD